MRKCYSHGQSCPSCNALFTPIRFRHGRFIPSRGRKHCSDSCSKTGWYLGLAAREHLFAKSNKCSVEGCDRPQLCNGLCQAHDARQRHGRDMSLPLQRYRREPGIICVIPECGRPAQSADDLCQAHWMRRKRGMDMSAPIKRMTYRRKWMDANGYVIMRVPVGTPGAKVSKSKRRQNSGPGSYPRSFSFATMQEHRYVMQCHIGRPLLRMETIHHKDGNRANNDIANLELRSGAHGTGINIIDGIEASLWWISKYAQISATARKLLARLETEIAAKDDEQLELWQHQVVLDEEIIQRAAKRK